MRGYAPAFSTLAAFGLAVLLVHPAAAHQNEDPIDVSGRVPRSINAVGGDYLFTHNVGQLTLQVTNLGILGNPFTQGLTSAGWRGGEYLFQAGLWVGAIGEDAEPHVSTAQYRNYLEFRPGIRPVDTIYESYEGIRGGARPGFFNGDDDGDGLLDEDFQNGKDDDGDGKIDEDFAAIGQQMFSCEYRDDTPEAISQISDHRPLGLKVRQRSFQWSASGIDEFVGLEFNIINVGDQRLSDIYIGFYVDADAGPKLAPQYWTDDLVGYIRVDTTAVNTTKTGECSREKISMDIAYIWDAPDDGTNTIGGDVPGYFGGMFLGHTTDATGVKAPVRVGLATVRWTSLNGAYPQGDPRTDFERYDLLSSRAIPRRNAVKPDDYRFTLAAGPFQQLLPGDELSFQTAFVIGDGLAGMIQNAIGAQRIFNGQYVDGDMRPNTGVDGMERCLLVLERGNSILWDDPCDTLTTTKEIKYSSGTYPDDCTWVDDDCNVCTGVDGREFLLNWVGTTAPPAPELNTDPALRLAAPGFDLGYQRYPNGDRHVVLQWDNLSELRPDPITGRNLFEGYRIWRVDNWQRPEGSIGPTGNEWMLLAEFRRHPRDGQGSISPKHIRNVEHVERNTVVDMTPFGPQYPVGRYEYTDDRGITNGMVYFYAVTAFGIDSRLNPDTGLPEDVEIGGAPAAVQKEIVVTSWEPGGDCADIKVVPNPYRGGADWDLHPSDCDPTGTKVAFRNLPEGWTRLDIYSLAGDLVLTAGPSETRVVGGCETGEGNRGGGTFYWDLISRSGQNIVAGVYLYVVTAGDTHCRGRFVIIR